MVILPYMNWGNLKLFLRQCKLVEANNPQVRKFCPKYQVFTQSFLMISSKVDVNILIYKLFKGLQKEPQNEPEHIYNLVV